MANFIQDPDRVEKELVRFTDEEGYGKFLDMHLLHEQYMNLKGVNVSKDNLLIKHIIITIYTIFSYRKVVCIFSKIIQYHFSLSIQF
jgi:hypothetical protein